MPTTPAASAVSSAVVRHRVRQRGRGLRRVEVQAGDDDAPLLRAVAAALSDLARAAAARALLSARFAPAPDRKDLRDAGPDVAL